MLASAPDALPPEFSGVGAPPGFQVWAPSSLICVRNRASGERRGSRAAYPLLAVQGRRGEGHQGPRLLPRVLLLDPECLYFLFLFEKFFIFKPPWSKQAPGCSQLSLALSQDSCSSPCAWAGASAALVPCGSWVPGTPCLPERLKPRAAGSASCAPPKTKAAGWADQWPDCLPGTTPTTPT